MQNISASFSNEIQEGSKCENRSKSFLAPTHGCLSGQFSVKIRAFFHHSDQIRGARSLGAIKSQRKFFRCCRAGSDCLRSSVSKCCGAAGLVGCDEASVGFVVSDLRREQSQFAPAFYILTKLRLGPWYFLTAYEPERPTA